MRRREFVALLGGAAACAAGRGAAKPARQPRLGILLYSTPKGDPNLASFLRALSELGYVDGQTISIEYRYAEGRPERLPDLAAELVRLKPDLLFGLGGDVSVPAIRATSALPILFGSSADPVQLGLVASLARPGGNATGVSFLLDDLASKRLEFLKEAAPHISRVAFVWNPGHPDSELPEAERAAASWALTCKDCRCIAPTISMTPCVPRARRAPMLSTPCHPARRCANFPSSSASRPAAAFRSPAVGEHGRGKAASYPMGPISMK